MKRFVMAASALAFALGLVACDGEEFDRCLDGSLSQAECCDSDPTYDFCEGSNSTNATNNANSSNNLNASNAENSSSSACEPACAEGRVCDDATTPRCVECNGENPCAEGVCDEEAGACVACLADGAGCGTGEICAGSTPECVECVAEDTSQCGEDEVCLADGNTCVACNTDADCGDPAAARCDKSTSTCVACTQNGQCTHLSLNYCDPDGCVECRPATEAADCGGNACDVESHKCSDIALGSATGCKPCVSDSSCAEGHYCVSLDFEGAFHGNYCMPVPKTVDGVVSCLPTYGAGIAQLQSVDGANVEVCSIADITTCEAISQFRADCTTAQDCEVNGVSALGARCEDMSGIQGCTYTCTSYRDCESGVECGGEQGSKYCGGPTN